MKIAYCVPALNYSSGMERVLIMKANYLSEHYNYEVHIIVTERSGEHSFFSLSDKVIVHNLEIYFDDLIGKSFAAKVIGFQKKQRYCKEKLELLLRTIAPDITISLLRRDVAYLNKLKDGSIKVGEFHFNRLNYRKLNAPLPTFAKRILERYWMSQLIKQVGKLSAFVVLTKEDAKLWPEIDNVHVIYNPIPFKAKKTSLQNGKTIMAAGRLVPQKGFDLLIDAWKTVASKHPDWSLYIYGEGYLKENLNTKINKYGLQSTCTIVPPVSNIAEKYAECSIFVLSSRFEGFGMVLSEAMSCGVPCVSFNCNFGPSEIISDGVDGFIVENGNIGALACKICELIENDDLRKTMAANAVQSSLRFSQENIMEQWNQLFTQLLRSNKI